MVKFHQSHKAAATVGAVTVDRQHANRFGIIESKPDGTIVRFHEKPESLVGIVPPRQKPLASMGIYVFTTRDLRRSEQASPGEASH